MRSESSREQCHASEQIWQGKPCANEKSADENCVADNITCTADGTIDIITSLGHANDNCSTSAFTTCCGMNPTSAACTSP